MDRLTATFVDGMGAAAATSGVLNQLQGRIFGLLYMNPEPLSLDDITEQLQQSKSNVSVQVRGLLEWHLVRQVRVAGSRKDHYEAATDMWRVMQEIIERRFRWNLRQVLAAAEETLQLLPPEDPDDQPLRPRLESMRDFFAALDAGIGGMSRGEVFVPDTVRRTLVKIPIAGSSESAATDRRGQPRPRSRRQAR
jgi:DNA-binding transcriptional regulator GbsR (MarR family)